MKQQIFFITETNTNYSEGRANSLRVSLKDDGDFHTYSFDMSQLSGWNGVITEIRLDPVYSPGIDIDIDYVRFAQP